MDIKGYLGSRGSSYSFRAIGIIPVSPTTVIRQILTPSWVARLHMMKVRFREWLGGPLMLRVVRCLPLPAALSGTANLTGQASDKPRGRKPRGAPPHSEQATAYGDLKGRGVVLHDDQSGELGRNLIPVRRTGV